MPSNAWRSAIWNGKLCGIPVFSSNVSFAHALFYRRDFFDAKGLAEPKSADELMALGKELTDVRAKRWAFDDIWSSMLQPFDVPDGWSDDGKGGILYKYELERYIDAMAFLARVIKAGYMHPDAVAQKNDVAKQRFASGAVALYSDGTGAWAEQVAAQALAGNKAFRMQAMAPLSASGRDKPRYQLGNGATLFSYLNRNLPKAKVEELLRLANYLAAPYGSLEYTLVNFGERGHHHALAATGPTLTATGGKEMAITYQFLATAPAVTALPGYPDWVKAYTAWQGNAARHAYKPLFFGLNVVEPARYASINDPVESMRQEVIRGKKTVDDFRSAVAAWRRQGGDALREFYLKVREQHGTGS